MVVRVKICGLTRPADAAFAAEAGASLLGVVFAGGPRSLTPAAAGAVVAAAKGVPVIGVFRDQSPAEIERTARGVGLAGVQLHGPYTHGQAATLAGAGLVVWRVLRIAGAEDLERLEETSLGADMVLVEPRVPHAQGGAGVPLDLSLAAQARHRLVHVPMALAGGLTPETVGRAVDLVRPDAVDVSSGVESLPGIKDHEKIARFLEAVLGRSPTVG